MVVERIHEYLTTMGEDVRGGKVKLDEFIIHKVCSLCQIPRPKSYLLLHSDWEKIRKTIQMPKANLTSKLLLG